MNSPSRINLYLIYSPLHYLAAESIVANFEQNGHNYLFYLKHEFKELVDPSQWDAVEFLPWPRFYPEKGLFGRMRRTKNNLAVVGAVCTGASEIRLHTPVIDTEAVNYFINFLQNAHPDAKFSVRLLPDGLLNVQRHPLGSFKEIMQYCKKARRLISPTLNYYTFRGDRTGSDAKIVDRIYVLPQLPHQYDLEKTVILPPFLQSVVDRDELQVKKRALVIGQPLIAYKRMSEENVAKVTLEIYSYLNACGIEEIYYKSHPRETNREYALDNYSEIILDKPLEHHLAEFPYGIVIGVYSTGLITGRLILPDWCKVVSCGINLVNFTSEEERNILIEIFEKLNVDMLSV